jgi:hypothetical protein
MARFVYVDETGSVGTGGARQPYLTLVAVIVDEEMVQPLSVGLEQVLWDHLGWVGADVELHGNEIWQGTKLWRKKQPSELLAAYEAAIQLLDTCDVDIAHSTIDKVRLAARYGGGADENAYRLALQFLLEKVDALGSERKIVIADETKEQELPAIRMVADLKRWGGGEVPGRQLKTIIDSLHFVASHASPGVQLADLVAYAIQRSRGKESHADAKAALDRIMATIRAHTRTWRQACHAYFDHSGTATGGHRRRLTRTYCSERFRAVQSGSERFISICRRCCHRCCNSQSA